MLHRYELELGNKIVFENKKQKMKAKNTQSNWKIALIGMYSITTNNYVVNKDQTPMLKSIPLKPPITR